jgi:hypothetical protein
LRTNAGSGVNYSAPWAYRIAALASLATAVVIGVVTFQGEPVQDLAVRAPQSFDLSLAPIPRVFSGYPITLELSEIIHPETPSGPSKHRVAAKHRKSLVVPRQSSMSSSPNTLPTLAAPPAIEQSYFANMPIASIARVPDGPEYRPKKSAVKRMLEIVVSPLKYVSR